MASPRQRRAPRSVPGERLHQLRQRLQPAHGAGFRLRIRCGHCPNRRLLDELAVAHDVKHDSYSLTTMLPSSARPGSRYGPGVIVADLDGNPLPGGITRPSVTRAKGAYGRPQGNPHGHDVWVYECHTRCGATYTFNDETMLRHFLRAFAEGRTEHFVGVARRPTRT
jgi:hypothetical protein